MNYYIIGIAGTITAPLAVKLKQLGHQVEGSDQDKIYPPISTLLAKNHFHLNHSQPNPSTDLVIVGSAFNKFQQTKKDWQITQELKLPFQSVTQFIAQNIGKKQAITVAGSFGKTTITALLVHLFKSANLNPCYMFGGQAVNNFPSLDITDSKYSILEGDESINGLDTQAKFLSYPTKHVIITSVDWEHHDSYSSHHQQLQAFKKLIQKIPSSGYLIYNPNDPNLVKLTKYCRGQAIPYLPAPSFSTHLIGQHNQDNISAAATLCRQLDIPLQAISTFKGVQRRLQIINQKPVIIDDFAQSPQRIQAALAAIKNQYPHQPIQVFFEPHASFLQHQPILDNLKTAFSLADTIVLAKLRYQKTNRVTVKDYQRQLGSKLVYLPLYPQIIAYFQQHLSLNHVLVHFSSGGLTGLQALRKIAKSVRV